MVCRERGLELVLVEREQRAPVLYGPVGRALGVHPAIFLARRRLQLGKALEAERLGEANHGRARRVRPPRQLLGGLERGLVEVVHDVLRDVLLRARALVESRADVLGEALVLARASRRGGGCSLCAWLLGAGAARAVP